MDDQVLEKALFPITEKLSSSSKVQEIDYEEVERELRGKGVTLTQLWIEYRQGQPNGLQYSQFCVRFRKWKAKRDLVMRQQHQAGEKLFVDYAGQTINIYLTGNKVHKAQLFVGVLGASNYTYVEATMSQNVEDWVASHQRAFQYFGGVPMIIVPDNLKSGVQKPSLYDPKINPTYEEMARHYQTAIMPARVRKPKDKAKAEAGVLLAERWICAVLRKQKFHSLDQLNEAIARLLDKLNNRPFKKISGSRMTRFQEIEAHCLKPLPAGPYELAYWKIDRAGQDYHVEVDGHYYSVPYQWARQQVDVRYTAKTIEVFNGSKRLATHPRSGEQGGATTIREHMPKKHRAIADWTPQKARSWASSIGSATLEVVDQLLNGTKPQLINLRTVAGLASLSRAFTPERLERACLRAIEINGFSYTSIKSILERGLHTSMPKEEPMAQIVIHPNIRGAQYYENKENNYVDASNVRPSL